LGYHISLALRNLTTNETNKWSNLQHQIAYQTKLRAETTTAATLDGKQPKRNKKNGEDKFFKVEDLRNVYNLGILHNAKEVLFPYSLRTTNKKKNK